MIEVAGGWETVLEGDALRALEQSVLPDYLRSQRWFGGKARQIVSVKLSDRGALPAESCPAFWALFEVRFADGLTDPYCLPLKVAAKADESARPLVLTAVRGPAGEAVLCDALADDGVCAALLAAVGDSQEFATREGRIRGEPTAAFSRLRGEADKPLPADLGPSTSSNSLVVYGRRLMLKLFRRLEPGVNPDYEIGRFLTEGGRFSRIPATCGRLEYVRPGRPPVTLAVLQAFVSSQADGWRHALDELARYYERAQAGGGVPPFPAAREAVGAYLDAAALLGRRTAEMHLALAAGTRDAAFAPEPMAEADVAALREEVAGQARRALAALRENLDRLPGSVKESAAPLLAEAERLPGRAAAAVPTHVQALKCRCHGDYHLGQVLWADGDFVLLDFEGEPTRTVEERRAKQSPLKDVAGMLRSFHYAAYAGLFAFTHDRPNDFGRLEPWAEAWRRRVSAAFLRTYRDTAGAAPFLPTGPGFAALLDAFMLGKAFYELNYELNNRPDWVRIPLRGVLALAEKGGPAGGATL